MRIVCGQLRGFCIKNEWAASAFALFGVALLIGSIWAVIDFNLVIKEWIFQNPLFHGLFFGASTLADLMLIFGLLCLGFSECDDADKHHVHAYRGRRSVLFPEVLHWVESLGKNPRRHPRRT
jgi:hypothetical protein